jgi:hypothetical protein
MIITTKLYFSYFRHWRMGRKISVAMAKAFSFDAPLVSHSAFFFCTPVDLVHTNLIVWLLLVCLFKFYLYYSIIQLKNQGHGAVRRKKWTHVSILRQTAPKPTYLSKLQSTISHPEMHLDHTFYPWNLQLEPSFKQARKRSRIWCEKIRHDYALRTTFDGVVVARRDSILE